MGERYDTLVVGAGYAGSIMAERLASQCGQRVLVVDRRPHIFHTNSAKVVEYLSRFTDWRPYEHRVLARVGDQLLPLPINRTTVNRLYGLALETEADVEAFYAERAEPVPAVRTSEDAVVSKVGRDLYETFFRGYSRKHWHRDPSQLHASVTARVPARTNTDDRYFTDSHQQMPAAGYTAMFERILDHPRVEVRVGTDFFEMRDEVEYRHLVFTGPIDSYFEECFGALPYRSLEFEHHNVATPDGELVQPVASVNEPDETVPHTRTTEYRHMTGQVHSSSTLQVEFPRDEGPPYYPIPSDDARALYKRYEALAARERGVTFVGRLGRYQYLNMDQVVGQALSAFAKLVEQLDLRQAA